MPKPDSDGGGTVTIAAEEVNEMLRRATELPPTFFVTLEKAKVLATGALEARYTYSNQSAPPPPA